MTKHTRPCQQGVLCIIKVGGRVQPYRFREYLIREVCPGSVVCRGMHNAVTDLPKRLTPAERRTRYFASGTPESASRAEAHAFAVARISIGAFDAQGALVAVAHLIECGQGKAELSFITAPEHRGRGLSRALARSLLTCAWQMGVHEAHLEVLAENTGMIKAMRHVEGVRIKRCDDDPSIIMVTFTRPPGHTPYHELVCGTCIAACNFMCAWAKAPLTATLTRLAA